MSRKRCSITSSKNGRPLFGTAALLHEMSKYGGPDAFLDMVATRSALKALEIHEQRAVRTAVDGLLERAAGNAGRQGERAEAPYLDS